MCFIKAASTKGIGRVALVVLMSAGLLAQAEGGQESSNARAEGLAKFRAGSFSEARELLLMSLEVAESEGDRDEEAKIRFDLSKVYESTGDYEAAEASLRRLLAMLEGKDELYLLVLQRLAANLERAGKVDEAVGVRSELVDISAGRSSRSPAAGWMILQKASTHRRSGDHSEAERLYLHGFAMLDDLVGDDAVILYDDHLIELADLYEQQGRFDEAADLHARYCAALEIPNRDEEVREARLPMALHSYSRALRLSGRVREAEEVEARLSVLDGNGPRPE